jgi:hypothetical protein
VTFGRIDSAHLPVGAFLASRVRSLLVGTDGSGVCGGFRPDFRQRPPGLFGGHPEPGDFSLGCPAIRQSRHVRLGRDQRAVRFRKIAGRDLHPLRQPGAAQFQSFDRGRGSVILARGVPDGRASRSFVAACRLARLARSRIASCAAPLPACASAKAAAAAGSAC